MRALIFVSLVLPLTSVSAEDVDANRPGRDSNGRMRQTPFQSLSEAVWQPIDPNQGS